MNKSMLLMMMVFLFVTMFAGGCAKSVQKANEEFTPQNEYYIGRSVSAKLIEKHGIYKDSKAVSYVNKIAQVFVLNADLPAQYAGYRVFILDTDEPMAFATPGSYIILSAV